MPFSLMILNLFYLEKLGLYFFKKNGKKENGAYDNSPPLRLQIPTADVQSQLFLI